MRHPLIVFALIALAAWFTEAAADIPAFMSYQGLLRDGVGDPVPDGDYSVTFRLYDVEVGGTALWTETQIVTVAEAVFSVTLGKVTPMSGLAFDVPYWLGISIGADPELTPRVELTSAPYAFRAAVAESLAGGAGVTDSDWQYSGDDIYRLTGKVGVGTATPSSKLHVQDNVNGLVMLTIENQSTGSYSGQAILLDDEESGQAWIGAYDEGHTAYPEAMVIANNRTSGGDIRFHAGGGERMRLTGGGSLGVGVTIPSAKLDVAGTARMAGFEMPTGASDGYVLTSDATGEGSWQAAGAISDGDWTIAADDMYSAVSGDVGIGTSSPTAKLEVSSDGAYEVAQLTQSGTFARLCNIERTSAPAGANDVVQIKVPSGSVDNFQFIECERGLGVEFAVDGDGRVYSSAGADLYGDLTVGHDGPQAATFTTNHSGSPVHVIHAEYTGTDASSHIAVYGECSPADEHGFGGFFSGGNTGVRGVADRIGSGYRIGVSASGLYGEVNYGVDALAAGDDVNYGIYSETLGIGTGEAVRGYSHGTGTNYAIVGSASGGTTNWAGYFIGNVNVIGTLSKTAGSFRIDHPLDPEGQYLQHSFVESPDMMNVYNGNVVLDGRGEAWVELPEWFEALNRDFRYQLTCIGEFAPVYVAEKIRSNRFKIAGGQTGMEVSWQVTGVRQDPYAEAHRVQVEVPKPPSEFGKYVHPELYGRPVEDGIGYEAPRERVQEPAASWTPAAPRERSSTDGE
jgi:hypothetical protein